MAAQPQRVAGRLFDYDNIAADPIPALFTAPLTGATYTLTIKKNGTLLIVPAGTIAAHALNLPADGVAVDGQEIRVFSSQIITAWTILSTGNTFVPAVPTAATASGKWVWKYRAAQKIWYQIG